MLLSLAQALDGLFFSTKTQTHEVSTTYLIPRPEDYPERLERFNASADTKYTPSCPLWINDPQLSEDQVAKLADFITALKTPVDDIPEETKQVGWEVFTDDSVIRLKDREVIIPDLIKQRPALMVDGQPNYLSWPQYKDIDMTVTYLCGRVKFASVNGTVLRARDKISNRTRNDLLDMHARYNGIIEADPAASVAMAAVDELRMVFAVHPDYLYFELTKDNGSVMTITVDNKDQTKTDRQTVFLAYAFARAAIYSYHLVADPIAVIEEDFAAMIVTLILSIRSGE